MPTNVSDLNGLFNSGTLNFAHRGFTAYAPENTLMAIQAAIDLGVDGIEFDVRVCKSGEVVVFHDPVLKRMTNGRGMVKDLTLDELRQVKIKQGDIETNEVIPTLEEVLALNDSKIAMNIEIKTNFLPKRHKVEEKVVDLVKKYRMENQTIISSFQPLALRRIKRIDETIPTGFLFENNSILGWNSILITRMLGAKAMHMAGSVATPNFINKVLARGYKCLVWTVNAPELMKRLISDGVHGIITDRPDVLKEIKMSGSYA